MMLYNCISFLYLKLSYILSKKDFYETPIYPVFSTSRRYFITSINSLEFAAYS